MSEDEVPARAHVNGEGRYEALKQNFTALKSMKIKNVNWTNWKNRGSEQHHIKFNTTAYWL